MRRLYGNLWVGDWQEAKHHAKEFDLVITTAFDSPWNGDLVIPLVDGYADDNRRRFLRGIELVSSTRKQFKRVLVHCVSGMSRSVATILGVMMYEGMTYEEADKIEYTRYHKGNPDQFFIDILRHYRS